MDHVQFLVLENLFPKMKERQDARKERKEARKEDRNDRRDAKNSLKNSEANLNNALAVGTARTDGGGMSTGAIVGIVSGSLLVISLIGIAIYKSRQNA